jgi:hypothetical protein
MRAEVAAGVSVVCVAADTVLNVVLSLDGTTGKEAWIMVVAACGAMVSILGIAVLAGRPQRRVRAVQRRIVRHWERQDRALLADPALQQSLEQMRRGQGRVVRPRELRKEQDDE